MSEPYEYVVLDNVTIHGIEILGCRVEIPQVNSGERIVLSCEPASLSGEITFEEITDD